MRSLTTAALFVACLAATSEGAQATLIRLDIQPGSTLDVSLTLAGALNGSDAGTSRVTGFFDADIDFDLQGRPVGVRIVDADLNASDVELSIPLGFPFGSLDVATQDLHLTAFTPNAPPNPPVDPVTGEFDLDQHRFRLDGGAASAESFFFSDTFDFAAEPEEFTPLDGMQGTLVQPLGAGGGPVTLTAPVALQELVATVDVPLLGSVDVFIDLDGTLVAEGLYVPTLVLGDTNGDRVVDIVDLNNVRNGFGGAGLGDANHDGSVDIEDLNAVRNNFGQGAAAVVPEPAAETLAAMALLCAIGSGGGRRRGGRLRLRSAGDLGRPGKLWNKILKKTCQAVAMSDGAGYTRPNVAGRSRARIRVLVPCGAFQFGDNSASASVPSC